MENSVVKMRSEHYMLVAIVAGLALASYWQDRRDREVIARMRYLFLGVGFCAIGIVGLFIIVLGRV